MNRWTESDALDSMFEKPQNAQVVRIKIAAVSPDSTSMAPSLDGPLLAGVGHRPHRGECRPDYAITPDFAGWTRR